MHAAPERSNKDGIVIVYDCGGQAGNIFTPMHTLSYNSLTWLLAQVAQANSDLSNCKVMKTVQNSFVDSWHTSVD